jgi:hypothetical protein
LRLTEGSNWNPKSGTTAAAEEAVVQVGQFLHLPLQSFLCCSPQADLHFPPEADILQRAALAFPDFAEQQDFAAAFAFSRVFSCLQQLLPQAVAFTGARDNPASSRNGIKMTITFFMKDPDCKSECKDMGLIRYL